MSETCQGLFYFGFAARRTHDVRINAVTAGNALLRSSLLFFASLCFSRWNTRAEGRLEILETVWQVASGFFDPLCAFLSHGHSEYVFWRIVACECIDSHDSNCTSVSKYMVRIIKYID